MNVLLSRLDEAQRRWYVAVEAERLGPGADRLLYEITGIDEKTIRRGRAEVAASLVDQSVEHVRGPGAGRLRTEDPLILGALTALVEPETAGDPMSAQTWVRCSLRSVQKGLEDTGHRVRVETVRRLLRQMDYALHVNAKKKEASSQHPDRDAQSTYIQQQRGTFVGAGQPIVSVDTKKKLRHEVARSERTRRLEDRPMPDA